MFLNKSSPARRWRPRLAAAGGLLAGAWWCGAEMSSPALPDVLEAVQHAFEDRAARLETLEIAWEGTIQPAPRPGPGGEHAEPGPPEPLPHQGVLLFTGDGRSAYEEVRREWDYTAGTAGGSVRVTEVSSGHTATQYTESPPQGLIQTLATWAHQPEMNLLTRNYRPERTFSRFAFIDILRTEAYDGEEHIVLGVPPNSGFGPRARRVRREFYVAPHLDHALTRVRTHYTMTGVMLDTRVDFEAHEEIGLIPKRLSFSRTSANGEDVVEQRSYAITDVKVNEGAADSRFAFAFPSGTAVYDAIYSERYVTGGPDDPRRGPEDYEPIEPPRQRAQRDLAAPRGIAALLAGGPGGPGGRSNQVALWTVVLLAVAGGAAYAYRRWKPH